MPNLHNTNAANYNNEWSEAARDGNGQFAIAIALLAVANSIERLGNNDADTRMGAIESLSKHLGEKLDILAEAIGGSDRQKQAAEVLAMFKANGEGDRK